MVLQTGRNMTAWSNSSAAAYNATIDAALSTQYSEDWNEFQVSGSPDQLIPQLLMQPLVSHAHNLHTTGCHDVLARRREGDIRV